MTHQSHTKDKMTKFKESFFVILCLLLFGGCNEETTLSVTERETFDECSIGEYHQNNFASKHIIDSVEYFVVGDKFEVTIVDQGMPNSIKPLIYENGDTVYLSYSYQIRKNKELPPPTIKELHYSFFAKSGTVKKVFFVPIVDTANMRKYFGAAR